MLSILKKIRRKYTLRHRAPGYRLLKGHGLEIGAMHIPAPVSHCEIDYCDTITKEEAIKLFPEIDPDQIVNVKYVSNLDTGLEFADHRFDFVILNHVIEHIANPINAVKELFRVSKKFVVLSAPDKNFTYDKPRALTSFDHLLEEYENNVTEVTDDHYMEYLRSTVPELFTQGDEIIQQTFDSFKKRREHAHVWDSDSFDEFVKSSMQLLNIRADCLYKSHGSANKKEYFSVWSKTD